MSHLRHGLMSQNSAINNTHLIPQFKPGLHGIVYAACGPDKGQCPGNGFSRAWALLTIADIPVLIRLSMSAMAICHSSRLKTYFRSLAGNPATEADILCRYSRSTLPSCGRYIHIRRQ